MDRQITHNCCSSVPLHAVRQRRAVKATTTDRQSSLPTSELATAAHLPVNRKQRRLWKLSVKFLSALGPN